MPARTALSSPLLGALALWGAFGASACLGASGNPSTDPKGGPKGGPKDMPQAVECTKVQVAAQPLQRLTQAQYLSSVRDLIGVTVEPGDLITPPDGSVGAFRSNATLTVEATAVDGYMRQAESLALKAMDHLDVILPCDPAKLDAGCVDTFITRFGRRAYRRPLTQEDTARYHALLAPFLASGDLKSGVRVALQTMLQSPHFLYRVEVAPKPADPAQTTAPLAPFELAARLSYFLWGSTPDDALLDAAAAGKLDEMTGLRAEAERLAKDDRARATIEDFHLQWLDLGNLQSLSKDKGTYAAFNDEVRAAMRDEVVDFVDHVMREGDGKLSSLLTAPYSVPGEALFPLYGIEKPAGYMPGDVVQLDPTQRAGLLTQTGFLALHAGAKQSSPVRRGKVILQSLLCQTLPLPPPNVNTTPPDPSPDATTREQFAEHEANPTCAACHKRIDPPGFAFEHYDGIGVYRTEQNGRPVDASAELVDMGSLDGPVNGAVDLAKKLADSPEVQRCVARQWFRYALARQDGAADACTLDALSTSFNASGHDVRALLVDIVASDAFRLRRVGE